MKLTITKLYYNILSILLINLSISCSAKDWKKLHMQSEVLDKKDNEQKETLLYISAKLSKIKQEEDYNIEMNKLYNVDLLNIKYTEGMDHEIFCDKFELEQEVLDSQNSHSNLKDIRRSDALLKKINKKEFAQISNNIIENYLKDDPIYQVVRNNEKLVDPVNEVSIKALLIKKFTKLPKFYTELFKKSSSCILNLILNYYISYDVEEELEKLTKSLQNIKLYEYYENFNKNLFYTLNNIKVLNAIKFHIEYLKKIKEYIENVEFYKPMYKNELTNIENFCNWFKNINTNIISKEYKNDLKFTEKQKLLLRDFSIIKSTEKDIQKKCTFLSINIKGESQIKSWVYDLLRFNQLIGLSNVNIGMDSRYLSNEYINEAPSFDKNLQNEFILYIQTLCNFGSLNVYLSQIYPLMAPLFSDFIEIQKERLFKYYVLKEAINKIKDYKDYITNVDEFMTLKKFISHRTNFDNKMLNLTIEKKAVDILCENNNSEIKENKKGFFKNLSENILIPQEDNKYFYNTLLTEYIKHKSTFFKI